MVFCKDILVQDIKTLPNPTALIVLGKGSTNGEWPGITYKCARKDSIIQSFAHVGD